MALPANLERLRQIPIDTLDLSEGTQALLKWFGMTSILDCIMFFYEIGGYTYLDIIDPWPRLFLLLFGEVKPQLIEAGYWSLIMDDDMRHLLDEYRYYILHEKGHQRVVNWQGRDHNLYEIPVEQLGLSDVRIAVHRRFTSVGACIDYFLYHLGESSKYWLDIGFYEDSDEAASKPLSFEEYMLRIVQPRLVEMGLWAFVDKYIDDVIEEGRFHGDFGWDEEDGVDMERQSDDDEDD